MTWIAYHLSLSSRNYPTSKYVGVYKLSTPSLLVRDLDLVNTVMARSFTTFEQNDFFVNKELDPLVSENPFLKCGDEWKRGRALVTPMLTIAKVKAMFPSIRNSCDKMSLYLSTCVDKEFEAKEVGGENTSYLE